MMNPVGAGSHTVSERLLVLAPIGRDGDLIVRTLRGAGISAHSVDTMSALIEEYTRSSPDGPGGIIIAEEGLDPAHTPALVTPLCRQPSWSDCPVIFVTAGKLTPKRLKVLEVFGPAGSITLIERPFQATTLISLVQVALRSRRRQYQVRDHLIAQELDARALADKAAELERSNRELEEFAAVASHDLQEPLRMITAYLNILQRRYGSLFDEKAVEYFGHITSGAHRMRTLILAILEYAKVGQGAELTMIDSAAALDDAQDALKMKLKSSEALIVAPSLPNIRSNRVLLSQLFQNLISNAVKFSREKPVITIEAQDTPQAWVFSVADNGIGIPAEGRNRLFKLFQRFHTDERFQGTGIGLATCRKIIDIHHGRLWVESTENVGSVFSFSIPKEHTTTGPVPPVSTVLRSPKDRAAAEHR